MPIVKDGNERAKGGEENRWGNVEEERLRIRQLGDCCFHLLLLE